MALLGHCTLIELSYHADSAVRSSSEHPLAMIQAHRERAHVWNMLWTGYRPKVVHPNLYWLPMKKNDGLLAIAKQVVAINEGTYEWPAKPVVNPLEVALFGGISGRSMDVDEFELCSGLTVRRTFAHVMAPYLLAFDRPKSPHAPHPAPWKSAHGGIGFNVDVEVAVGSETRPTGLDRLNTIWWVLALLRLVSGTPVRMPVISDMPFSSIATAPHEPNLWTIEMSPRQLQLSRNPAPTITFAHLEWVRSVFIAAAPLLDEPAFNRAFQTLDSVTFAHSPGSALLMTWASIETLFRPGRVAIGKSLCSCVATFLQPAGSERDRLFTQAMELYEARGGAIHDSQSPELDQLINSYEIARLSVISCLERRATPNRTDLLDRWRRRT